MNFYEVKEGIKSTSAGQRLTCPRPLIYTSGGISISAIMKQHGYVEMSKLEMTLRFLLLIPLSPFIILVLLAAWLFPATVDWYMVPDQFGAYRFRWEKPSEPILPGRVAEVHRLVIKDDHHVGS